MGGRGGRFGRFPGVTQRGRFGRQHLFGFVYLAAFEPLEGSDFIYRKLGEKTQEAADVGIFGIAPELPVFVRG